MSVKVVCDQCGASGEPAGLGNYGSAPWRRMSGHTHDNNFKTVDYCSVECQVLGAERFDQEEEQDEPRAEVELPRLSLVDPPSEEEAGRVEPPDLPVAESF